MANIDVYGNGGALTRDTRRAARAISRYQTGGQVRVSAVDTDTDVAIGKTEAITQATGAAMSAVVRVAQAQTHLEQLAPAASARLNYLADEHMLAMGDVMADLRRDIRRK